MSTNEVNDALRRAWRGTPAPEVEPVQQNEPVKRRRVISDAGAGTKAPPPRSPGQDLNEALRQAWRRKAGW